MQFCFEGQIGQNLEVYVNDIVIKTWQGNGCFNIKLNLEKCTFGVPRGKLLGYIITKHGIEANLDKISAIAEMGQGQKHQRRPAAHGVPHNPQPFCVPSGGTRTPSVQVVKKV
jgi:hypothetical protein